MRIGVIGVGAIGGPVAAQLLASRRPGEVIALAAGRSFREVKSAGLRVEGVRQIAVPAPEETAEALPRLDAPYDLILLCTRTDALEAALAHAVPLLAEDGALVCIQNGLPEERAAKIAGKQRTLGGVVSWSGGHDGPGRFRLTSSGPLTLGAFDGAGEQRIARAQAVLSRAVPVRLTQNLAGARWSKLAINCALSSLGAVSGLSLGELAARADVRQLALEIIGEVVMVGHAYGIRFEKVSGVRPEWLGEPPARSLADLAARPLRHALLYAAALPHRRQRSGMLARLEAGRPSGQIDDLNGAVVQAARDKGLSAPLNQRLTDLVHAIERKEERIGLHQLPRLRA